MDSYIDQTQSVRQYVFRTDNTVVANTNRANTATKTLQTYQDFIWQKPKDVTKIFITAIGGGGSGGPGASAHGRGGGSGSVSHLLVDADQLPDYLTVRVGYGGDVAYAPNTVTQIDFGATVTNQYRHPNNAFASNIYRANVSVYANQVYTIEAWGGGGGGGGYSIIGGMTNKYSYAGGGGGYSAIRQFSPPSDGTLTIEIPPHENAFFTPGPDTYVFWSNTSVSNVELLFAGGGKTGQVSGTPAPGVGGQGRANSSYGSNTYTANGGTATYLVTVDPTGYKWGSGGGGAGGPQSHIYDNNSYSRNGGVSGINGLAGGNAANTTGFNGGSASTGADGLGGGGGGASAGVPMTTSWTGTYGGNGSFPGGGGGTGFYWRGRGNGGAGAPGCVRITAPQPTVVDVTPRNSDFYNGGEQTTVFCGPSSDNVALLVAKGGPWGLQVSPTFANGAQARVESRGATLGQSAFYNGAPIAPASSNATFLANSIVSQGVTGGQNYANSLFTAVANLTPSTTEFYQSSIESLSPLFSSGGTSGGKYQAQGAKGGFGSGGGGGLQRFTYPFGGAGGRGGDGIVIITCW